MADTNIMDKVLGIKPAATSKEGEAAGQDTTKPKTTDEKIETDLELDESKVLAFMNKKHGKEYKSLDELSATKTGDATPELTKEEKEALAKQKKDNTLIYGIQTGKVKADELSAYAVARNADPVQWSFDQFKAEALAENKDLTEEEIRDQFDEENFLNLEADDKKRIRAERRMLAAHGDYLKKNFGHIDNLDAEYEAHETEQISRQQYDSRIPAIVAAAPKEITNTFKAIGNDGKEKDFSYKFKIPEDAFRAKQEKYLGEGYFKLFNQGGLNDDAITNTIINEIKLEYLPKILADSAAAYHTEMMEGVKMGRLGALPIREETGSGGMAVGSKGLQVMDKILNTKK